MIEFAKLTEQQTTEQLEQKVEEILRQHTPQNPPSISDCLVNLHQGGQHVMTALGERYEEENDYPDEQRYRWKIRAMRDEWGNEPKPGDVVVRKIPKGLYKRDGRPVSSTEISRAKMDGSFADRFEKRLEYIVDEKGCISCNFEAAVYFLNNYGVHNRTGYALTRHPEHSTEPTMCPDGQKRHVWYWRYKEVPQSDYEALPMLTTDKNEDKRGYKKHN